MSASLERIPSAGSVGESLSSGTSLLNVSTESAVTAFNLAAGVSVAVSQILAARRLAQVDRSTIGLPRLALPALVMLGGGVVASFLVPSV